MQILIIGVLMLAIFAIVLYLFHRMTTPRVQLQLQFIKGFAKGAGILNYDEALEKWRDFVRVYPEKETRYKERTGTFHDGYVQGLAYRKWEGGE